MRAGVGLAPPSAPRSHSKSALGSPWLTKSRKGTNANSSAPAACICPEPGASPAARRDTIGGRHVYARERTIANPHWMSEGYSDAVASGRGISSAHKPQRAARRGQPAPASSVEKPRLSRGADVGGRAGTWKEHPQALLLRGPAVRQLLVPKHLQVVLPCRARGSEAGARESATAGTQEASVS
jgi:hypothetical protein